MICTSTLQGNVKRMYTTMGLRYLCIRAQANRRLSGHREASRPKGALYRLHVHYLGIRCNYRYADRIMMRELSRESR